MSGIIHTIVENETIYLKKDKFGYRIVHPIKNEDGTINKINLLFGGWRNLLYLLVILAILGAIMYSYRHDVQAMKEIVENPCNYCRTIGNNVINYGKIGNWTALP